MLTVPKPPAEGSRKFPDGRAIVYLRVDLGIIIDASRNLLEWKVNGWATHRENTNALHALHLAMRTRPDSRDAQMLQRLAVLLEEYCEPF